MSDLLQDIDNAIKQEKAEKFWRENGPYMLGGALMLVVFTAAFTAWNSWQLKVNTRQTNLLVSAMETPYPETALAAAAQALDGKHKAMAQLQAAGHQAKGENPEAAIALYKTVAADNSAPSIWRDLATLMAVRLEWNPGLDQAKAQALYNDLKPLLSDNNPWHLHATLQAAMITGDSLGDYKTALGLLGGLLSNAATPQSLKDRARALDHLYAMKLSEKEPPVKAPAPAEPKG
ncbi:MAG: tetratricopeptide repeat protein [Micavibrio sp.]